MPTDKQHTGNNYDIFCPQCHSDNVVKMKKTGFAIMLSIMLLGLPLPIFKKKYYCFDCEFEWEIK